jgi:DNA-binding transcriptional ArsR family regulator
MVQITQERDGWSRVPHWLLAAVPPSAVVVYAQLAAYAWMPDGARPAIKRVAHDLKMSESTVKRAIGVLEEAGAVVVEQRTVDGVQLPNRYHLKTTKIAPDAGGGFTSEPTGGFTSDPRVGSPVTYEEEGVREEEERKKNNTVARTTDIEFDLFWQAYPRRSGRVDALKAWRTAVKASERLEVVEGARRYRDDPNRVDSYTKLPATWLRAGCWTDDPLPPRAEQATISRQARDQAATDDLFGRALDRARQTSIVQTALHDGSHREP